MKKDILDRIIGIYYVILIIALCFMGGLSSYDVFYSDFISNTLIGFGIVALILYVIYRIRNNSTRYWDLIILIMSFLGYLSYYYAFDKKVALKGFLLGREGLLVIYTYYMTFLLSSVLKNTKMKNRILMTVTICGALQVIYGLLQVFRISNIFGLPIVGNWKYASGFVFNSNFFGSYMVLLNGLWMSRFFFDKEINYKNFLILFIFITGLLISGAMSAFVALIVMMLIIIFIYFFVFRKRFNIKKVFLKVLNIFLIFLISFIFVNCCNSNELIKDVRILNSEVFNSATSGLKKEYGTGRVHIWKESLKYFPKYIWTGVGIDNFIYLGKNEFVTDYISGVKYSKAHNEYLQILLTEGIFMFVIYLLFLGIIFIKSLLSIFRNKKVNYVVLSLFLAYFGYCIQAFFNISMIKVAPIFYMISGMLVSCVEGEKLKY